MAPSLRWRSGVGILAAVAASFLFTLASERWGRLVYDLQYDDVSYAVDAVQRLDAFRQGGLPSLAQGLYRSPPHSPLSSLQALAAFDLLGVHDIVLYASNLWLLLALAMMVVAATRRASDAVFAIALAFALLSPPAYALFAEFRPDPALGLATCAMVMAYVGASLSGRAALARWAGAFLGAALLAKPTFFVHTLVLAFALCGFSLIASSRAAPASVRRFALPGRSIAEFLGIGVALALPYFAAGGSETWTYFWANTRGAEAPVWNLGAALGWMQLVDAFRPHLFALPRYHLGAAAAVTVLSAACLAWRGARREAFQVAAFAAIAVLSGAIIVFGRHPSPYFFASMDWLLVFAAIVGYAHCDAALGPKRRLALAIALSAGLVVLFTANVREGLPGIFPDEVRHSQSRNERIVDAVKEDVPATAAVRGAPSFVLVGTAAKGVNPLTLRWVSRLREVPIVSPEVQLFGNLRVLCALAAESDYLVLPLPAADDPRLPIGALAPALRAWATANPAFERIGGDDIAPYLVLANRERLARHGSAWIPTVDGGVLSTTGLGGVPRSPSRPLVDRNVRIALALPIGRPVAVHLRFASRMEGRLTLSVPGGWSTTTELRKDTEGEVSGSFMPFADTSDITLSITGGSDAPQVDITALTVKSAAEPAKRPPRPAAPKPASRPSTATPPDRASAGSRPAACGSA